MDKTETNPLVLIVDDEALLRMHAADLLEDAGYATLEAANADEALRILEQRPEVRLLFTDIQMPGKLDGLGLAREVHRRWPKILLVVTSGQVRPSEDEIPDNGCFVAKPYAPEDLLTQVDAQVDAVHNRR
jgi:CheY-like chemotaxis protein